jgi:hypothetical protein
MLTAADSSARAAPQKVRDGPMIYSPSNTTFSMGCELPDALQGLHL